MEAEKMAKGLIELLTDYQNRFNYIMDNMRMDLIKFIDPDDTTLEEVPLGEVRKVAILTECLETEDHHGGLRRQHLSSISQKYGRRPTTCGVFFRPDVNLLETRGRNNLRYVTEKGRTIVYEFRNKFGMDWITENLNMIQDSTLPDSYKIKIKLKSEQLIMANHQVTKLQSAGQLQQIINDIIVILQRYSDLAPLSSYEIYQKASNATVAAIRSAINPNSRGGYSVPASWIGSVAAYIAKQNLIRQTTKKCTHKNRVEEAWYL